MKANVFLKDLFSVVQIKKKVEMEIFSENVHLLERYKF